MGVIPCAKGSYFPCHFCSVCVCPPNRWGVDFEEEGESTGNVERPCHTISACQRSANLKGYEGLFMSLLSFSGLPQLLV